MNKQTDKYGHELLGDAPVHKSGRNVTDLYTDSNGNVHELTNCIHCGTRMSKPRKQSAAKE